MTHFFTKSGHIPVQPCIQPPAPNPTIRGSLGLHFSPPDLSFDSPPVSRNFEKKSIFRPQNDPFFSLSRVVYRPSCTASPQVLFQLFDGPWAFILPRQTFPLIPHQFRDILEKIDFFDPEGRNFCPPGTESGHNFSEHKKLNISELKAICPPLSVDISISRAGLPGSMVGARAT